MHENKLFLPGQYEVEVNQKHLDKGIGNCTQSCVIALALKDAKFFNRTKEYPDYLSVMPSLIMMELNGRYGHSYITEKYMMLMTRPVHDFIKSFDDHKHRGLVDVDLPDPCMLKLFVLGDEFCYMPEQVRWLQVVDGCHLWDEDKEEKRVVVAMMTNDKEESAHQIDEIHKSMGVPDITSDLLMKEDKINA